MKDEKRLDVREVINIPSAYSFVSSFLFQVVHVRSMSEWAPLCIGPYSQSNRINNSIVFVAGKNFNKCFSSSCSSVSRT